MLVFKKPSKAVPAPSPQTPGSLDSTISESNTTAAQAHHSPANKTTSAPMRYSDVTAGHDTKDNGTHIEKLMYIPELCEEMLDYLSMKELLRTTRVCRAFKSNIENSSRLQAKLFLAPDLSIKKKAVSTVGTLLSGPKAERAIEASEALNSAGMAAREEDPMLCEVYGTVGEEDQTLTMEQTPAPDTTTAPSAASPKNCHTTTNQVEECRGREIALYTPHPWLLASRLSDRYRRMGIVKYSTVRLETRRDVDAAGIFFPNNRAIASLSDTSILNRMFVSQPPAKEVSIWCPCPGMQMKKMIRNEAGVTIGEVAKAARWTPSMQNLIPGAIEVVLQGGFVANTRARNVVEKLGELSAEEDPTRWVFVGDEYVLQDGGFAFA